MFQHYTFKAKKTGKNILILGAVHGNETAGTNASLNLIKKIKNNEIELQSGSVTFIPIVNEKAYQEDKRFVDINLNRVVKEHKNPQNNEEKIANALIPFIKNCDVMIDLHSTHCEEDKPFAFLDYPTPENINLLNIIPVETALTGWPEIYKNEAEISNFCTEEYAYTHHKQGITIECGYHKSPKAIETATKTILNTLNYYQIIKTKTEEPKKQTKIKLHSFVTKKEEGSFSKPYQHLDKIKKGEVIAEYKSQKKLLAPFDGYIIMPNPEAQINAEWFYIGK